MTTVNATHVRRTLLLALALALTALPLAGCRAASPEPVPGPAPAPQPEPTPEPEEPVSQSNDFLIYLIDGETLAVARRSTSDAPAVAMAAMNELLGGPEARDVELGYATEIPEGTELLGIDIDDSVATVDLSGEFESGGGSLSMTIRVAQVVYTLTQFDTVDAVRFMIDGAPVEAIGGEGIMVDPPVGRDDFADNALPSILVESPAPWDEVSPPLRVTGISNTFEATLLLELVDASGLIIYEGMGTATAGSGTWGTFEVIVDYEIEREGIGALIVFEESAKDGSRINLKEIPIDLKR